MATIDGDSASQLVGVDTNILINFGSFKRLAWQLLFPGASSITVLVAAKVQSEMDHHKDHGAGYVRKRAKEFQAVVRAAEDDGYEHSFDDAGILVKCVFLDRPRAESLDAGQFDLADADELIVAQYHHAARQFGDITIVANDASTIRAAKRAGMSALRPNAWTADRSEPEDDTTRALRERTRELERIVGARPKLELTELKLTGAGHGPVRFGNGFEYSAFQDDMRKRLSTRIRLPSRSDLIKTYGRQLPSAGFAAQSLWGGIGDTELDAWEEKVRSFTCFFDGVKESEMLARLTRLGVVHLLDVTLTNCGDAPEVSLCVDLEARGETRFFKPYDLEDLNDWKLRKPDPPKQADSTLARLQSALAPPPKEDEHVFYRRAGSDTRETYRRGIMLQGQSATIRAYLIAKDVTPRPSVLVTIGAQHLLDPVVREIPLSSTAVTLDLPGVRTLMWDRLSIMPDQQADVLRVALKDK